MTREMIRLIVNLAMTCCIASSIGCKQTEQFNENGNNFSKDDENIAKISTKYFSDNNFDSYVMLVKLPNGALAIKEKIGNQKGTDWLVKHNISYLNDMLKMDDGIDGFVIFGRYGREPVMSESSAVAISAIREGFVKIHTTHMDKFVSIENGMLNIQAQKYFAPE